MKLDLVVGQTATRTLIVSRERVDRYAEITGDRNPLHFDKEFAAGTKFGRLVAHGGITTGLLHALVAEDMPGPGTVFLSQNWKFTAPVYVGDTISAMAEVLTVHEAKPVCQIRVEVRGSDGATVLEGEAWCYRFQPEIENRARLPTRPATLVPRCPSTSDVSPVLDNERQVHAPCRLT